MTRLSPTFAIVLAFFAHPLLAAEPLPKEVAFSIEVNVRLTLDYGFMQKEVSMDYLGSSVCVSPDGYIITNVHVADPGTLITRLVSSSPVRPQSIARVYLKYRIGNMHNLVFTTDFKPDIECDFRAEDFSLRIVKLESRPDQEASRQVHIIKRNDQDAMIIKLDHDSPLPFLCLPTVSPSLPIIAAESPQLLYALVARQDENFDVVAVTRIGQTNDLFSTIVCHTMVTPITMTTIAGDSGSIIIDSRHQPVGLLASHELPEVSDVSFMIPIDRIAEFYETTIRELAEQEAAVQVENQAPASDKELVSSAETP